LLEKASEFSPAAAGPYVEACELYNQDLKIPTLHHSIVSFLKSGSEKVRDPLPIFERLAAFYRMMGNDEMSDYYKMKSNRKI